MGGQSPRIDFAAIGHQDSWQKVKDFIDAIRDEGKELLSMEQIREIFPWIPPRVVFRIEARSVVTDCVANGIYVETFIPPEQLANGIPSGLISKVKQAAACAEREGAGVASLGGFTSIVLEGNTGWLSNSGKTAFTTGNTLTASLIVKGVEQACLQKGIDLAAARMLIIGSTGDIGSACVSYFSGKVSVLMLNARKEVPLARQAEVLQNAGNICVFSTQLPELLPTADVIISVASTPEPLFNLEDCMPHTLICDAGYPKNIRADSRTGQQRLWHGGMGKLEGGYFFEPENALAFYHYPADHVSHGCLIESMVLSWEKRYESYSTGRGNITVEKMEELWRMAQKHGVTVAPFFNTNGLWSS